MRCLLLHLCAVLALTPACGDDGGSPMQQIDAPMQPIDAPMQPIDAPGPLPDSQSSNVEICADESQCATGLTCTQVPNQQVKICVVAP